MRLIQIRTEQTLGLASRPDAVRLPRAGHVRAVAYMRTPEFRRIASLLDAHRDTGGVYFRPIDRGVCAVDLHPGSAKPRIGVGKDPVISQWRLDLVDEAGQAAQRFTDLIAIDLKSRRLVIIELKAFPDRSAGGQAARYREAFETNAERLLPFFESVALMMGELYSCPELSGLQLAHEAIDALVAWPSPENASSGEALTVQEVARPAGPQ